MNKEHLKKIVDKFSSLRIAIVGDLMLDVYVWGKAERISPEAPVPVVQVEKTSHCLGGAANVMRNAVTLGAKVNAFGIIGEDQSGEDMKELFGKYDIDSSTLSVDKNRRTTKKQRLIASSQQLLRLDFEDTCLIPDESHDEITRKLLGLIDSQKIDAIIFEDYGKGVLSESMLTQIIRKAQEKNILTALDPKPGHLSAVKGLSVMKPNRNEAFALTGTFHNEHLCKEDEMKQLQAVAEQLLEEWEPDCLIISLASDGMALFRKNQDMQIIPTQAREVYDVSGAGDTVIATFTLALATGATAMESAEIANHAAGIVVGKVGTVSIYKDELVASFS